MKNYLFSTFLMATIAIANAENITEGTYVGQGGKRINIGSYQDNGTYQYNLLFANQKSGDLYSYQLAKSSALSTGQNYVFKDEPSDYDESEPSPCQLTVNWNNENELEVQASNKCNHDEKQAIGSYAYSKKSSKIPEQYHGKWGNSSICMRHWKDTVAMIDKDWFTNNIDWGAAIVINSEQNEDGSLTIHGVETYEDIQSFSHITLKKLGKKLHISGEHHAEKFNNILVPCTDK